MQGARSPSSRSPEEWLRVGKARRPRCSHRFLLFAGARGVVPHAQLCPPPHARLALRLEVDDAGVAAQHMFKLLHYLTF
jgi:hypothetical protein